MDAGGIETSARYPYLGYQTYCRMYNKPTGIFTLDIRPTAACTTNQQVPLPWIADLLPYVPQTNRYPYL